MNKVKTKLFLFSTIVISCVCDAHAQHKVNVARQIALSVRQYQQMANGFPDTQLFPQSVNADGSLRALKSDWWGSGFFPGSLWYLYEYTKDAALKAAAEKWTEALEKEQYNTSTHDLGFMLYCSYGNGYRLTQQPHYRDVLLKGAASLATRFNPKVGLIKSWDEYAGFRYPVIIDNMMNLEFLLWAAKVSGSPEFRQIALSHANRTLQNHFRADYSSYHVVMYDSTGQVITRKTAQGHHDESAWARGQAWGLYGYTVMYRETHDKKYLDQAVHIARFFMNHSRLRKDKIPYWDLDDPGIPNVPRDASAAAVAASALLELAHYTNAKQARRYYDFAEGVLFTLSSPEYFAATGNHHFLLKHSTGNLPKQKEIDVPLIYADYYYLEALLRYDKYRPKMNQTIKHN